MWTSALNFAGVALLIAFAGWIALGAARPRAVAGLAASLLALAVALPPSTGHAFERREGTGLVTVAANETVDDTLLVTAQTVVIDGTVTGDLLAFARSVTVRGNVAGNLITAAETVTVEGTIGGSVIGAARGLTLSNARVGRDLYGFGRDVEIGADSGVSGNAIAFGEHVDVDGRVGVDFAGFGSTVTISGAVEGDVEGFAETLTLLPSARVGGNVTARVDSAGDLTIAQGAVVGGTVNEQLLEREQRRNRYLTVGQYVRQIVRLGGAFLVGLLLLWAVPVLRDVSLPSAGDVLRSGGIGLAAAVTLPVAAFLVCITIVGLPLGMSHPRAWQHRRCGDFGGLGIRVHDAGDAHE
jgi:cytoskeletal protein CcmA (bactofilin family)